MKKVLILGITVIALSGLAIISSQYPNLFSTNSHTTKKSGRKEQQLEDVKKHGKEIEDFVKSLSPKTGTAIARTNEAAIINFFFIYHFSFSIINLINC